MSKIFNRQYRLSVIEQKVEYTGGSAPKPIKQSFYSAWNVPPVDSSLAGIPTIGVDGISSQNPSDSVIETSSNTTKTYSGGDSVMIKDLHITAEINSSTGEGEAAKSTIRVFNASKTTRAKLERKNAYIILEAGYENDIGIVFTGTVIRATSRKQGTEMVTELLCQDSNVQLKTSRVSFAWPPNTTYDKIFNDVVGKMKQQGIASGFVDLKSKNLPSLPSPAETKATGGYSFQGMTSQLLDKLCEQFQYSWYIALNEIYIHPRTFNSYTVQYSMNANLIKSIEPQNETVEETPNVETPSRFLLTTFLDHRIKVGQRINVTAGQYSGVYKVVSVDTKLSYLDGGSWDSDIVMEAV